jgi:hypothetical protein
VRFRPDLQEHTYAMVSHPLRRIQSLPQASMTAARQGHGSCPRRLLSLRIDSQGPHVAAAACCSKDTASVAWPAAGPTSKYPQNSV